MKFHGGERSHPGATRREALRQLLSVGFVATAAAGLGELLRSPLARADQPALRSVPLSDVLAALPADAPQSLVEAIQSGCCIHFYVAEFHCGSGGCGAGWCCYHIVNGCGGDYYQCLNYPCSHGNFSTGC